MVAELGSAPVDAGPFESGVVMHIVNNSVDINLADLERELDWFAEVVRFRIEQYFSSDKPGSAALEKQRVNTPVRPSGLDSDSHGQEALPTPPELMGSSSAWATFIREGEFSIEERVAVVLSLVPHLRPVLLDIFFTRNLTFDRRFTEFGGVWAENDFEPNGETLAFLLGGSGLRAWVLASQILEFDARLRRAGVLSLGNTNHEGSHMKAPLRISADALRLFTLGHRPPPVLGAEFPAHRLETKLEWDDLVLHPGTLKQVGEILKFIAHGPALMREWGMASRLRPGHRALFYGPPGTGKTLTAALLGKQAGRDVYRVDLSLIVSKYIGETEKNLRQVFDRAQDEDWILFFDEADALFGKRTETKDAHDRHANQEVAYLLQRIEQFNGIVVLASNMRDNLDAAFSRRFESVVFFPLPRSEERLRLWQKGLSQRARLASDVSFDALAKNYELAGGSIMNVLRQVSLTVLAEDERPMTAADFEIALRRELAKDGRHGAA